MAEDKRYTITELAKLSDVSVRTIRYYIQEGIIDRPLGRGRGAHFDDRHLLQLKRTRLLQSTGFDLNAIRDEGVDMHSLLTNLYDREIDKLASMRLTLREALRLMSHKRQARMGESGAMRLPMADGVDLLVSEDTDLPSPRDLVEIAMLIRGKFGGK